MRNEYVEKCQMLGFMWGHKFNSTMTSEDHKEFHKDCKDYGVNPLDVYECMEDYEIY